MTTRRRSLLINYNTLPTFHTGFSLRKMNPSYAGNCILVRRSSDNTTLNIGFDSNGNLDETALLAFVGGGSGFVVTWYDQSGGSRNLTQAITANQPRIVNAGVVDKINGKPCVLFDGINDRLVSVSLSSVYTFIHNGSLASVFLVGKSGNSANPNRTSYFITTTQNTNGSGFFISHTHLTVGIQNTLVSQTHKQDTSNIGTSCSNNNFPPNQQFIVSAYYDTDASILANRNFTYKNNEGIGASNVINQAPSLVVPQTVLQLGSRNNVDSFLLGQIQEIIIFNSHPAQGRILQNINNYWSVI